MLKRLGSFVRVFSALVPALLWSTDLRADGPLPQIEKVADLAVTVVEGVGRGPKGPYDQFLPIGTNYYFLTDDGGQFGFGTVSVFHPETREARELASLDVATGNSPRGTPVRVGDWLYFLNSADGAGDRGTLARFSLVDQTVQAVFAFGTNDTLNGITPFGSPLAVGDWLYFTTSGGGANSHGTIMRYDTATGAMEKLHDFLQAETGRQPFEGFTRVGDSLYFTTFAGGTNSASGFPNGAGTLGRFDLVDGTVAKLVDLPTNHTAFPGHNPVLVGSNDLYFTTVGSARAPGGINRYRLDSGTFEPVFTFTTNHTSVLGKQPYGPLVEFAGDLYFTTFSGGYVDGVATNRGTLGRFNPVTGQVTKLLDLDRNVGAANGSGPYGGPTLVHEEGRPVMYVLTRDGGASTSGTILKLVFPAAEPVRLAVARGDGSTEVNWTGGYSPYRLQTSTDLASGEWTDVGAGTTNTSVRIPVSAPAAFFRVSSP